MKLFQKFIPAIILTLCFGIVGFAKAQGLNSTPSFILPAHEVRDETMLVSSSNAEIDGVVNGELFIFGSDITISGIINGDVIAAGSNVKMDGVVNGNLRAAASTVTITGKVTQNVEVAGTNLTIANDAKLGQDVFFAGSILKDNGAIDRDLKGMASSVVLAGSVGRDVKLSLQQLSVSSAANIGRNLVYKSDQKASIDSSATIVGTTTQEIPAKKSSPSHWLANLVSIASYLLIGLLLIVIMPKKSLEIGKTISTRFWPTLIVGFATLILMPIIAAILMMTIIGIPIGALAFIAYVVLIYISRIFAGIFIGHLILGLFKKNTRGIEILSMFLGIIVIIILARLPIVGPPLNLLAMMLGIGSVLIVKKETWQAMRKKEEL